MTKRGEIALVLLESGGNVLVKVIVCLVAHLTVVVVVQRPRLRDVRQVLPEDAFGHGAEFDSLSDALGALPFR